MAMSREQIERAVEIHYEIETTGSTTASVEEVQANVRLLAADFEMALSLAMLASMLGRTDELARIEEAGMRIGHIGETLSNYLESIGVVPDLPSTVTASGPSDDEFLRSIGIDPDTEADDTDY